MDTDNSGESFTEHTQRDIPSVWRRIVTKRRVFSAIAALALLAIIGGAFVLRSLPGEAPYRKKVWVLEPALRSLRLTQEGRARYELSLLGRRLGEIKRLHADSRLSGDAFFVLRDVIGMHIKNFKAAAKEGAGISPEDLVAYSSEAVAVLRAAEKIVEASPDLPPDIQAMEDYRRSAAEIHREQVRHFAEVMSSEDMQKFIQRHLGSLDATIAGGSLSAETAALIEEDIRRAARAVERESFESAVRAIMQAEQRILTAEYLTDVSLEGA